MKLILNRQNKRENLTKIDDAEDHNIGHISRPVLTFVENDHAILLKAQF
jgi:hypothetical protein